MSFYLQETLFDILKLKTNKIPTPILNKLKILSEQDWIDLADFAARQNLASLMYSKISNLPLTNISKVAMDFLKSSATSTTFFNMMLVTELKKILNALNNANIPVIVLKGAYLIKEIYPCINQRQMADIDLLLPQEKILEARKILGNLGYFNDLYDELEPSIEVSESYTGQLLPLFKDKDDLLTVDIHWNIASPKEVYSFDVKELWQRAYKVDFWGEDAFVLNPEDLVIHICHHGSYHDHLNHGLRIIVDLVMIIEHFQDTLDWQRVQTTATKWQWDRGVCLCLLLTHDLFNLKLSDSIYKWIENQNLPTTIISLAKEELMNKGKIQKTTIYMDYLVNQSGLWFKLKLILQRIFLHPSQMAVIYPIKPTYFSFKLYFYYLIRMRDTWLNNREVFKKYLQNDPLIASTSERRSQLKQWLLQPRTIAQ